MAAEGEEPPLNLFLDFDPEMQLPRGFVWKKDAFPMSIKPGSTVMELTHEGEAAVGRYCLEAGFAEFELCVNVAWNAKSEDSLPPRGIIRDFCVDGDTVFVHADLWKKNADVPKPESDKLPVTILTGFLGAGKTTLLNYILQEQRDRKIAVIENEFGSVSIDDELLGENKLALAEQVIVMDNGCMCCTVRGDLEDGLRRILVQHRKGSGIDAVIIETTGMADPVPIVRTFMTADDLADFFRLDGVVTVADTKHILARLDDNIESGKVNEAYQQVAFCDKILLNKIDLVSKDIAIEVKKRIRSINAFAKILPTIQCEVNLDEITNMHAHDVEALGETEFEVEPNQGHGHGHECSESEEHGDCSEHGHGHGHDSAGHGDQGHTSGNGGYPADVGHGGGHGQAHGKGHGHSAGHGHDSRHDSRVNSTALVRAGEIPMDKISEWIRTLGGWPTEKGTIFRMKAILAVSGQEEKHVLHAVMDVMNRRDAGPWKEGEAKVCKMVFIGKDLDLGSLRAGWETLFAAEAQS